MIQLIGIRMYYTTRNLLFIAAYSRMTVKTQLEDRLAMEGIIRKGGNFLSELF